MIIASVTTFVDSLEHITGFLIVLAALTILWGITALFGKIFGQVNKPAAKAAAPSAGTASGSEAQPVDDGPSDEEVVAICAAVACMLEERHRVVSIRSSNINWGREGLRDHFASRRIR